MFMTRNFTALPALAALIFALSPVSVATAQQGEATPPPLSGGQGEIQTPLENPFTGGQIMTGERLGVLVQRVDPNARVLGNGYTFKVQDRDLRIVYDENADRMRIITPIIPAADLPDGLLQRMMQANFDSVLDTRYAIGSGNVWASFVHRLSSLTDEDFISGIAQTAVAAETFGTTFSSGAVVFGGGDSNGINQELLERLQQAIQDGEDDRGI